MAVNRLNRTLLNQLVGGRVAFVGNVGAGPRYLYVDSALTNESKTQADQLEKNPFYDKYRDKIAAAQKSVPKAPASPPKMEEKPKERMEAKPAAKGKNPILPPQAISRKRLSDVLKTELIKDKTAAEISHIWHEFHKNKPGLSAVLPGRVYRTLHRRSQLFPSFLLPLPRSQGYEFVLSQFEDNEVHMTLLINYQAHKENAPECLSLVYYPELLDTKDVVPMRGEYDSDCLTILEAQCLANTLQLYYGEEDPERTRLLDLFTNNPTSFDHMDLIKQMETLGLYNNPFPKNATLPPPQTSDQL